MLRWFALIWIVAAALAQAPRDTRPPAPSSGTASIQGRITDQETARPLDHAVVTLSSLEYTETSEVEADDEGRYRFTGLRAGRYVLGADPGALRATHLYGYFGRTPGAGSAVRPPAFALGEGEARNGADIALGRALAIEGRVVDAAGEPMANVNVTAINLATDRGSDFVPTDDRGSFRVFGLPGGSYRLCADPGPDRRAADEEPERYVRTCAPAVPVESDADVITLRRDVIDVEIRVQRGRVYSVAGTVTDSSGLPASAYVNVSPVESRGHGAGARAVAGQFLAVGLGPGRYIVRAAMQAASNREGPSPDVEVGLVPIRIESTDVTGVAVSMSKGARVVGRVVFDGSPIPSSARSRLAVVLRRDGVASHTYAGSPVVGSVGVDLQFTLTGLFGPTALGVDYVPDSWLVKAVLYKGVDITDLPTTFTSGTDPRDLEIVLTDRGIDLSARVVDGDGHPVTDCAVVLASGDPARWIPYGNWPSRQTVEGDSIHVGRFRAGEYLVAAVNADDYSRLVRDQPRAYELLSGVARRITLDEKSRQTIDLTLASLDSGR